ncbi:MAG: helix-turn-helix domain-containing protein [Bacteroidetes bacterium]|nr:helix-turn-helix domain-containing protein [Bacteroidota bacterium]
MPDPHSIENDFLSRSTEIVEENLSNEQFGVSELAREIGMSRSNLLRKIKKLTGLSVSQFIRKIRLQEAMEILKKNTSTVSEVSYKVGFGSTSYFIKCFHDYYGYPPGELGKRKESELDSTQMGQYSKSHQLAAIMFTDIQGYTALMQKNEKQALDFRNRHREVFNTITKKFKGKILQYYGDGTLSTFKSAIDAVRCGIKLQLAFREDPQIPVRIGIHSGDILFTKEDIIGDGVNVASRIESLAVAGSVFISEKVYDEVKNQPGIHTISLGEFELKNVGKPLEVFAITNPGLIVPKRDQITGKEKSGSLNEEKNIKTKDKKVGIIWMLLPIAVMLLGMFLYSSGIFEKIPQLSPSSDPTTYKKSIAVLPFINDSNDSTNVYIINGLMESILNSLQKIEDLRVISRTSIEKYRNTSKTIPEIAEELNVNYFVEGSGQKIDDQILLNIQLIGASSDKNLLAKQYNRETRDIFNLQIEVAKDIAAEIEAIITPEEEERINKASTDNLVAYDFFLKGLDFMYKGGIDNLEEAIIYYEKAIEHDNEYARAYAGIAITYFFLNVVQPEKEYSVEINSYADKALLFDPKLPQSLIAKALYYVNNREYKLAVPYLEKALLYNPNSAMVINTLAGFYNTYIPNTEKYLEYALKGIQLDIAANDSMTTAFIYMHISNAFIKSGFIDEAELYIDKSFDYYPENLYAELINAYIRYAKNKDLAKTKMLLMNAFNKDTSMLELRQEIGKICYYMRDYESAYQYYKKIIEIREFQNLDVYVHENDKIGFVLSKMEREAKSSDYLNDFRDYSETSKAFDKHVNLAMFYSYQGDTKKAIEHLKLFSEQSNFDYWILLFAKVDPLLDPIKDLPEFKKTFKVIESKFWDSHKRIQASLKEKELL